MTKSLFLLATASLVLARPISEWPVPGESNLYNTYRGQAPPFPGTLTKPILPTANGAIGSDDVLFQNLEAAEWIIASFYQQGVEAFNASSFTDLGYPNDTYARIQEIRDNEFGHLNIFYREISDTSVKPGPCKYTYPFTTPQEFLALQVVIEVSSITFLTGLVQQAATDASRGALLAISSVETRHNTWALISAWNTDPFAGPSDTMYPYPEQILQITNGFVVKDSCPSANPEFPSPNQNLPALDFKRKLTPTTGTPGSEIEFTFPGAQPHFTEGTDYYVVYFHGLYNESVPFDPSNSKLVVPTKFDRNRGIIIAAISDLPGAPSASNVVAGPVILLEQPGVLTQQV